MNTKQKLHDHPNMQRRYGVLENEVIVDKEWSYLFSHFKSRIGMVDHIIVSRGDFFRVYNQIYNHPHPNDNQRISIDSF